MIHNPVNLDLQSTKKQLQLSSENYDSKDWQ